MIRGAILVAMIVGVFLILSAITMCAEGSSVTYTPHFHVGSEVDEYALGPTHAVGRERRMDIGFLTVTTPLDKSFHVHYSFFHHHKLA